MSAHQGETPLGFPTTGVAGCASGTFETHAPTPFLGTDGSNYNRCFQGGVTSSKGSTHNQGSNRGGQLITNQAQHGAPITEVHPVGIACVNIKGQAQMTNQNYYCAPPDKIEEIENYVARHRSLPPSLLEAQQLISDTNMHQ